MQKNKSSVLLFLTSVQCTVRALRERLKIILIPMIYSLAPLLLLLPSLAASLNATITNMTVDPSPANTGRFPLLIHAGFTATVTGNSNHNFDQVPPAFLDAIVEICPPHPFEDQCHIFKGGHFNRTSGVVTAIAEIATDFAWWEFPPGSLILGSLNVLILFLFFYSFILNNILLL